ncbi:hypothetical protein SKTS_22990 [Sulfurimicrobium lacus]|uniref:DUF309 domain-containing protein n=1 Tax=Sulfurimicrobium lacus TaxID=2715678 RepID=A0A6F8VC46_9PROT|nr:DUF309 domain-containing protein [Sulfurimicrobium lacus]BCB27413.1 hypothetical protein SKTS_22990 [Sulfurimicrobium lacus]
MNHEFAWDELELLWNANNFGAVHDWLGERWNYQIQTRPAGHEDPDAQFLQGLAFAALAFYFTQNHNQDGAALLAEDGLARLARFLPVYRGLEVAPVLETLHTLRPLLEGLEHEADCPMQPFVFNKLAYQVIN